LTFTDMPEGGFGAVFAAGVSGAKRLASVGRGGRQPGQLHWVRAIGLDSQGNLYLGEADSGKRVQKFRRAAA
jgi:hypothetical protein